MILVTANEMQQMDRQTIESFGIPGRVLMENAGRGATAFLFELFPDIAARRVGVIAGRGNNGGDGYVATVAQRDRVADGIADLAQLTAGLVDTEVRAEKINAG